MKISCLCYDGEKRNRMFKIKLPHPPETLKNGKLFTSKKLRQGYNK